MAQMAKVIFECSGLVG